MARAGMSLSYKRIAQAAIASSLLVLCGNAGAVDLKIASVAPDGSHWMQEMRAGAELIRSRTNGRVAIKFYPGGVMGNDAQVLRKVRIGQLQGGAFTAGGLGERYSSLNLYGIPLLFRSLDEVDYIRSRLDPKLLAGLEQAGFVSFGFIEGGFANLLANEPVRSVEDMRRRKVWVPEGDQISFLAMQALGLSPVVLPLTDVLTGLQTGLIEIAFASPVAALVLQWHTKVKYITKLPISYSMGIFAIEADTFRGLDGADQQIIREVMGEVTTRLDRTAREDNARADEVLQKSGLQPVDVNAPDVAAWRRTIEGVYPQLRERPDIDGPMLDELLGLLAEHRASRPASSSIAE
ncbi:MAG TPA: TRAP transporter substrate-binding protein DctP [Gammaproteobacteria bacterium]|nr:TRAP transporter substrate-binding protein DctP [Gammaproteobacteria bacterium]